MSECSICGAGVGEDDASETDETGLCRACASLDPETLAFEARLRADARTQATIGAYYAAARHAVALVRVYQAEPTTSGRRERETLVQVSRYRGAIRDLRRALRHEVDSVRPGLSKAGGPDQGARGRDRAAG